MTEKENKVDFPQLNMTREQLIEKINRGENLTDEEINLLKYHNAEAEHKELNRIIPGVNNVFSKHYDFKEFGLEFDIKIKALTLYNKVKFKQCVRLT